MPSPNILYFPEIEFVSPSWLKYALCIWDRVYRIVPGSYDPTDDGEVGEAVSEGLVQNISLTSEDLDAAAEGFLTFLDEAATEPAELHIGAEDRVRLHRDKTDSRVYEVLEPLSSYMNTEWLDLSRPMANAYMLYLAEAVSRSRAMPKLASNPDFFACMTFFSSDGNIDDYLYSEDSGEAASALVIQSLLPGGIDQIDMGRFLELREGQSNARGAFREAVSDLTQEVASVSDENVQRDVIDGFHDRLVDALTESQSSFGQKIKEGVMSLLSVGVPTALTAYSALGLPGDPFSYPVLNKSVQIGVVAALSDAARSRRPNWQSTEAVYYNQIQGLYGSDTSPTFKKYDRLLEEYIND